MGKKNQKEPRRFPLIVELVKRSKQDAGFFGLMNAEDASNIADPSLVSLIDAMAEAPEACRVITVDYHQARAIQQSLVSELKLNSTEAQLNEWVGQLPNKPPFPAIILDFNRDMDELARDGGGLVGAWVLDLEAEARRPGFPVEFRSKVPAGFVMIPIYGGSNREMWILGSASLMSDRQKDYHRIHPSILWTWETDDDPDATQADAVAEMTRCLLAAAGVFSMLESVNVDLVVAQDHYPKGHVAHKLGLVNHEVVIRQDNKRYAPRERHGEREYSHRFERRGGFVHHRELTPDGRPNRVFAAWKRDRPDKIMVINDEEVVRYYRRPAIVGDPDLPLVIKTRRIAS